MSFVSLLFFIYLLVIPLVIIGFGIWLWRYMNRMSYAQERSILLTVIVMACLTFVAFSLGARLNKQRIATPTPQLAPGSTKQTHHNAQETVVPPQDTQMTGEEYPTGNNPPPLVPMTEEDKLRLFEIENFPELYQQRLALVQEIRELEIFFRQINSLARQTPKQTSLLKDIALLRKRGYDQLKRRNISVSQHLRDFWVHYNTGNSHDAIKKFTPVAAQLSKKIQETRGGLLDDRRQEARIISTHMAKAGNSLKDHTIPASQAGKITAYTTRNRLVITNWLENKGSVNILGALNNLVAQRNLINERIKQLQSFRRRYPDLNQNLVRTEKLWTRAREANYYAEYRLLYAAEASYVVEYMDLAGNTAGKRLNNELNTHTRSITIHANTALERAEQAYKPGNVK